MIFDFIKKILLRIIFNTQISSSSSIEGNIIKTVINSRININNSLIKIGKNTKIINCKINIISGEFIVGDNVILQGVEIDNYFGKIEINDNVYVYNYDIILREKSLLYIDKFSLLEKGDNWRKPRIGIASGSQLIIKKYNRIKNDFEIRFSGICKIGEYNCINEQTEIRADESVLIGSYNMISYRCRIWDTNTHTFYEDDKRRQLTRQFYPNIGIEVDKPLTKIVSIGNDNLIGEGTVILKGTKIHNNCIIGTRTVVCSLEVPNNSKVVGNPGIIK